MTPLNEMPTEPKEKPKTDCAAVKAEWDAASATGHVSSDLMQKALECNLVPKEKVKGMPTGKETLPTRSENPLAGEDKELGMAELVMAYDPWTGEIDFTPDTYDPSADIEKAAQEQLSTPEPEYVQDSNGNWVSTKASGEFSPATPLVRKVDTYALNDVTQSGYSSNGRYYISTEPNRTTLYQVVYDEQGKETSKIPIGVETYYDKNGNPTTRENAVSVGRNGNWSSAEGIKSMGDSGNPTQEKGENMAIQTNYFGQYSPTPPEGIGNMEWQYKYRYGLGQNQFNPEQFYFNPDDKGNAGQTSSPYARIGNRGNLTPEIVKQNRPFYDAAGIDKYTNQDKLKYKNRMMQMAEVVSPGQDTPMGAAVDQSQGASQEVDEQVQEQLKEAISQAGFNVVDIAMSPEGKILVTVGQFEDSYIENAQYFEMDFELAEPMKCSKRFKAIAVTPGMYKAKDGTLVELSSQQLQGIAGLFRNKPLVLVDHDLARPDSTHEGKNVGFVEDSWYDPDYDAVIYKGVLGEDLDLAAIAGSSIKLTHGKTPMGRHIALIPKCVMGKACYAPQDPNAVILENAQKIGER